jgi:type IV pilus assembly protein PilP
MRAVQLLASRSIDVECCSTRGAVRGRTKLWRLLAATAFVTFSGCGGGSMSDLESYVGEVLSRPGGKIAPIPPLEPYIVYTYQSSDGVDPFEPFFQEPPDPTTVAAVDGGPAPDPNRNKEELEGYSLDSLRMMGTLEQDETVWGIIRTPDGAIHRVQSGNYMGRNHGKITHISEEKIELTEIVADSQGRWQERPAGLALAE